MEFFSFFIIERYLFSYTEVRWLMKKVCVLFGGTSSEHFVSCHSAESILENIDRKKYHVHAIYIDQNNHWYIGNDDFEAIYNQTWVEKYEENYIENVIEELQKYDVIFPMLHGKNGEDGRLQGMLELFQIPYVGCSSISSAIAMDKDLTKIILNVAKIPQLPYVVIDERRYQIKDILKHLDFPMIVKPSNGGSSIGIGKANNKKELAQSIREAGKYDHKIIIEPFIQAKELECAVLEHKKLHVSTIGEIIPANEFYDYNAKYENANSLTIIPANIPKNISKQIQKYAKAAFRAIDGKEMARIDFFYDEKNDQIYLNEINPLPGFTTISMYPKLLIHDKMTYKNIINLLIDHASV